jgi:hypothetical protein
MPIDFDDLNNRAKKDKDFFSLRPKRKLPKVESYQGAKREAPSYFDHVSKPVKVERK